MQPTASAERRGRLELGKRLLHRRVAHEQVQVVGGDCESEAFALHLLAAHERAGADALDELLGVFAELV